MRANLDTIGPVPADLLAALPVPMNVVYAPPPESRFLGVLRSEPGIADVIALGPRSLVDGSYTGTSRPSLGQY